MRHRQVDVRTEWQFDATLCDEVPGLTAEEATRRWDRFIDLIAEMIADDILKQNDEGKRNAKSSEFE